MTRAKLKQEIIDIFLRNLEGKTLEAMADEVIDAAYAALKEPTEEMTLAARHLMIWIHSDMPTEEDLALWCTAHGRPTPENCNPELNHAPSNAQQATWVLQAMLTASPLAPVGGKD